ncbi:hypothetical protein JB92DRAFT_3140240 [Gautieria morchelliformis]|nr:hypothetical protein JB92DRAFT_3140240 [Gautieria morchelliformis]
MIYSSDYLPARSVGIPGPPGQLIASLLPDHIHRWIEEQETHGIVPTAATIAGERRVRAFGFGSQQWDPNMALQLPPGWIHNISERTHVRMDLLRDINDLVTVYNNLTGSACLFITTHPEHDPKLAPAEVGPSLLKRNTLIIPGDNISGHRLAVTALAEAFASSVALPWTHEWKKRAAKAGYITKFTPDIVHDGNKTPELVTSPVKRDHIAHKGYLHSPSPVTANEKPPTAKPMENPSTIPDFLFDSWLRLKLKTADQADMQPQCSTRKVPAVLFDMVDSL